MGPQPNDVKVVRVGEGREGERKEYRNTRFRMLDIFHIW